MDEDEELYREMNEEDSYYMGNTPKRTRTRKPKFEWYVEEPGSPKDTPHNDERFTVWDFILTVLFLVGVNVLFVYACT